MKRVIITVLSALSLAGCGQDDQQAFDLAQKEVKTSVKDDGGISFKDMKLVRVVKFNDKTSKGTVCGKASNPNEYTGYRGFAVSYKSAFSPVSGELYYATTDKVLPGQDYETLNALCE